MFDVNVFGVQRVTRAALPQMRKKRVRSDHQYWIDLGRVTLPFFGLYGASKFAVEALTESYRYELSQLGVDVVLVQPSAYPDWIVFGNPAAGGCWSSSGIWGDCLPSGRICPISQGVFSGADAPDSHDVAKELVELS